MELARTLKRLFSVRTVRLLQRSRCCSGLSSVGGKTERKPAASDFRTRISSGPSFQDFIRGASGQEAEVEAEAGADGEDTETPHYLSEQLSGNGRKVYFETYGCQMNVNDTEIAWAVLRSAGYTRTAQLTEAQVVLLVTCSIREKAEQTIWNRLQHLTDLKKRSLRSPAPMKIGILGCMAERLKAELLEQQQLVDLVVGPDAYRDLPRLLTLAQGGQRVSNVLLSLEETYADIMPVQRGQYSAFVSIMRGCDNMCSYCIVPFTRGRERSRPLASILKEVQILSDQGVKEVTLLGQNVNSYRDTSELQFCVSSSSSSSSSSLSRGFSSVYREKPGGLRFSELLHRVSDIDPDLRIRFTSPHPKDFPEQVLQLISERGNICNQIHLPVQSGSSRVLEGMRRGYSREAYLDLVENIRTIIPGVSLSSDFISGFCGETEEDHQQTLSLIREVGYNVGFLFAYSMRKKTRAYHRLQDDVPPEVKNRRLRECISVFREEATKANGAFVGSTQLVLVEGDSKRSVEDLSGRTDGNLRVIFPKEDVPVGTSGSGSAPIRAGDYVLVQISSANSQTLRGRALSHSSLRETWSSSSSSSISSISSSSSSSSNSSSSSSISSSR